MNASGADMFFVKSLEWEYESEWRMLMPLADSSKVIERQPYPAHLFGFPVESVSEVIFGARMSEQDRVAIKALMNDEKFGHVKLYKAELDNSSYKIVINQA